MLLIFIDGTAQNSGQRFDNVNQTHLVLASCKLVLPEKMLSHILSTNGEIYGLFIKPTTVLKRAALVKAALSKDLECRQQQCDRTA